MRLLCAVFEHGLTLRENCCEHDVHGRADRNDVKIDMCAMQAFFRRFRANVAALGQSDLGAERLEALDVLVDRPHTAEVAAAGHCNLSIAVLAEQHAEQIIGSAQLALQLVRLEGRVLGILDFHGGGIDKTDLSAQLAHDLHLKRYIDDFRYILDADRAVREQSRRYNRDRSILRARNRYFTVQRLAAVDYIFGQSQPTPHCTVPHRRGHFSGIPFYESGRLSVRPRSFNLPRIRRKNFPVYTKKRTAAKYHSYIVSQF